MSRTLRIAWFSPLNTGAHPGDSVGAYCTDLLLPELAPRYQIELFHDGFERYRNVPTAHYVTAIERHRAQPFDLFLYHLEDRRAADFVRFHLALMPGIVWFHDFIFSTHGPVPILNSAWEETARHFSHPGTAWLPHDFEYEERGPIGVREGTLSAVALFSSQRAHGEFRRHVSSSLGVLGAARAPSFYLPLPVSPPVKDAVQSNRPTVALCATPRIEHRSHKILGALATLQHNQRIAVRWLLDPAEEPVARAMLEEFGVRDVEVIVGRSPARWSAVIGGSSVAIHTLFSAYGQPGPYLDISLRSGIPAIVSRFGEMEGVSESVVFQIEPGACESQQMAAALERALSLSVSERKTIAARAASFAEETHDTATIARELAFVIESTAPHRTAIAERWNSLMREAGSQVRDEARRAAIRTDSFVEAVWPRWCEPVWNEFGWTDAESL